MAKQKLRQGDNNTNLNVPYITDL